MKYSRRVEIFRQVKERYAGFLASVLWKLTGDKELFAEALQYSMLAMWKNVEKLTGKKAGAYIYRIALTANSKAWRFARPIFICLAIDMKILYPLWLCYFIFSPRVRGSRW